MPSSPHPRLWCPTLVSSRAQPQAPTQVLFTLSPIHPHFPTHTCSTPASTATCTASSCWCVRFISTPAAECRQALTPAPAPQASARDRGPSWGDSIRTSDSSSGTSVPGPPLTEPGPPLVAGRGPPLGARLPPWEEGVGLGSGRWLALGSSALNCKIPQGGTQRHTLGVRQECSDEKSGTQNCDNARITASVSGVAGKRMWILRQFIE